MAGNLDFPASWRLRTAGTQTPFKVLGVDGDFTDDTGSVTIRYAIPASGLITFLTDLMPPATVVGNISFPTVVTLDGDLDSLGVQSVSFKSFDDELPIDPFNFDPTAPIDTYFNTLEATVTWSSEVKKKDTNVDDPFTFLEISANASGEYLYLPNAKTCWVPQANPDDTGDVASADGESFKYFDESRGVWIDTATDAVIKDPTHSPKETNRDPSIPVTITVPLTEWNVRWPQIPFTLFRDVLIHRLRVMMGRVNSVNFPLLFNAAPETLLFLGYRYQQKNTWRDGQVKTPPVTLDMKFLEKRVVWKGYIVGHNHFWRVGKGWELLLHDCRHKVHSSWDFNDLLRI